MINKFLRFLVILAVVVGVGFYLFQRNSQFISTDKLPDPIKNLLGSKSNDTGEVLGIKTENFDPQKLKVDPETLSVTLERGGQVVNQAKDFFQGVVKVDESKGDNLPDRAVKYATYVYCKQVVDEWEKHDN